MQDFLTLKFLVTPYLIVLVYWLVALILPLVALVITIWISNWLIPRLRGLIVPWVEETGVLELEEVQEFRDSISEYLHRYRWVRWAFWSGFILLMLTFELIWRLICEFLIVYYNIHDALMDMAAASGAG